MTPRPLDDYLREKLTVHVAAVLEPYLEDPDELWLAADDVIEAIESEMIWAAKPEAGDRVAPIPPPTIE